MRNISFAILMLTMQATSASAQTPPAAAQQERAIAETVATVPGKAIQLGDHSAWRGDCTARAIEIAVVTTPDNGAVLIEGSTTDIKAQAGSASTTCVGRKVAGKRVAYAPKAGFTGTDKIVYRASYEGRSIVKTVTVNVR